MFISSKLIEVDSIHIQDVIHYLMGSKVDHGEIVYLEEKIIEKAEWDLV
jgi:F420-0:gamma-glutamyl ligase-like protein